MAPLCFVNAASLVSAGSCKRILCTFWLLSFVVVTFILLGRTDILVSRFND